MELNEELVKNFAESLRMRGRQPATIESYGRDAQGFVEFIDKNSIPIGAIDPGTLVEYQNHLRIDGAGKENSVRRAVIGIRQFFRFIAERENMGNSPLDDTPIPPRYDGPPEKIDTEDLDLLFDQALLTTPKIKSTRDGAILALLGFEGLKAGELINLKWSDFLDDDHQGSLKISGPKSRVIRLSSETTIMLSVYRESYREYLAPADTAVVQNRMFIAFKGRDAATPIPKITRHGLKFMLYELGEKTGLKNLNTEMLRHHATSYLLEHGKSVEEIMAHFGLRRIGNIAKHVLPQPLTELDVRNP